MTLSEVCKQVSRLQIVHVRVLNSAVMGKMKVFGKSEIVMLKGLGLITPEKEWLWRIINYRVRREKITKRRQGIRRPKLIDARGKETFLLYSNQQKGSYWKSKGRNSSQSVENWLGCQLARW